MFDHHALSRSMSTGSEKFDEQPQFLTLPDLQHEIFEPLSDPFLPRTMSYVEHLPELEEGSSEYYVEPPAQKHMDLPAPFFSLPPLDSHNKEEVPAPQKLAAPVATAPAVPTSRVVAPPVTSTPTIVKEEAQTGAGAQPPKKRQRRKGPLDSETLAKRRARHNQVEIRRRQKIAERFAALKTLTACTEGDKGSILKAAIDKVEELQKTIASMKASSSTSKVPIKPVETKTAPSATTTLYAHPKGDFYGSAFVNSVVALAIVNLDGALDDWNGVFGGVIGRIAPTTTIKGSTKPIYVKDMVLPEAVNNFFRGVDALVRGDVITVADAVNQIQRLDNQQVVAVRSMMWLVRESGAPKYLKLIVTPVDDKEYLYDRNLKAAKMNNEATVPYPAVSYFHCATAAATASSSVSSMSSRMVNQEA